MKTYPYHTPEGIIQLVEKRELDQLHSANAELLERLAEARESHLAASARDVQTIQRQAILLERLAAALKEIAWIKDGQRDYSWTGDIAFDAFCAYQSANFEPVANPINEAVKRMEEVPMYELDEIWFTKTGLEWDFDDALERIRARLIQAAKGEQP